MGALSSTALTGVKISRGIRNPNLYPTGSEQLPTWSGRQQGRIVNGQLNHLSTPTPRILPRNVMAAKFVGPKKGK